MQCASVAVDILENIVQAAMEPQEAPSKTAWRRKPEVVTGAKETRQLIAAYGQKVRSQLAARDFEEARVTSNRAVKLFAFEDERLRQDFDDLNGLQGSVAVVELLRVVAQAIGSLHEANSALNSHRCDEAQGLASSALKVTEFKDFGALAFLRAELYGVRADASFNLGDMEGGQADAERAVALDGRCSRAKECLEVARSLVE